MPIYEYSCDACGHTLDALQKMSDAPLTDCPACDKADLRKLVSAPSFRLKGNGWYETDFKDNGKEKKKPNGDASTDSGKANSSSSAEGSSSSKDSNSSKGKTSSGTGSSTAAAST